VHIAEPTTMNERPNAGAGLNARQPDPDSAAGLLSRLVNDVSALFRNEVALAKAELTRAANRAKVGAVSMATGAAVLVAGLLALVAAAILALAQVVEPWLAALLIGAALAIVGFVMLSSGKKKIEPSAFTLERTQQSLRRDSEIVRRAS
jgi:hypothetical protein